MLKQPAFFLDMTACTGCKTCMIACIDGNDLPQGVLWRRVAEYSGGGWAAQPDNTFTQSVFAYYVSVSCNHCANPVCVKACPTTAMHQTPEGFVRVDTNKCVGCRYCEQNCPYSAPQYNAEKGTMSKCDFCYARQQKGETPWCVAACPMRALHFGEYEELVKKYGNAAHIAPLPDPALTGPRLVINPARHAKALGSREGRLSNPEEV